MRDAVFTPFALMGPGNSKKPVRIGNAASFRRQLDVYGELIGSTYQAHRAGIETTDADWRLQSALMVFLEPIWDEPDERIWEVRGGRTQFTHSKIWPGWRSIARCVSPKKRTVPTQRRCGVRDASAGRFTGRFASAATTERSKRSRKDEARALFERLPAVRNDLGLYAEE